MSNFKHKGEKIKQPLHYTECGLDDVYLLNGYEHYDYHGDVGLAIKDIHGLHRAVGLFLVTEKKALNGKELRFLRKQLNLTQSELGAAMRLSSQQVARWEKSKCDISGPADIVLRVMFLNSLGVETTVKVLLNDLDQADDPIDDRIVFEAKRKTWRHKIAA